VAEVAKTRLDNGIRILSKRMPHVKSISMGVWVSVGARDESPAESGLSHFIEHMIFKGTRRRSAFDIAKSFDAIGGHTNAFTSYESTCYHAKVLDIHLATMVDILSDIVLNSLFDPNEIETERPVILQEIGMLEDNPEDLVHQLASSHFWGDHPLGRPIVGSRDTVLGFQARDIRAFFHRVYQPQRLMVVAAGRVNHDQLVDLVSPTFGRIPSQSDLGHRRPPVVSNGVKLTTKPLEQAHLCFSASGLPADDPRRYAMSLLNTIIGGNMSSRLFQNIRERRGLAYSVYSYATAHQDTGVFGVYAGVDPGMAAETTGLICEQLRLLCEEPVSASELTAAKAFSKGNLLLAAESNDNQMVRLAQNEILFRRQVPIPEVLDRIEAVTADGLTALARAIFQPNRMALTVLGPMSDSASIANRFAVSSPP
jgi:predicted Zn-dependent peptidase